MDAFLSTHHKTLKTLIADVHFYDKSLQSLSQWWGKIALIGKINSLDVAATILEDMDSARSQFHLLQERLINNLIHQHARKALLHHHTRCQMAIDVLIRNLYERTADIGFLSTDDAVIDFIQAKARSQAQTVALHQRLQAYIDKYSVYNDVVLLDTEGRVVLQLSQPMRSEMVYDECVQTALTTPGHYVEFFGCSQLIGNDKEQLLYLHSVQAQARVIGVVVLCFRFRNEITAIFDKLNEDGQVPYVIVNHAGKVLNLVKKHRDRYPSQLTLQNQPSITHHNGEDMLLISASDHPYQGYTGPSGWRACAMMPLSLLRQRSLTHTESNLEQLPPLSQLPGLFSNDLLDIRYRSTLINNDLELIVLNGIITAARSQSAEFMPVLEAIKHIGRDIDAVFAQSIDSLFSTILSSQLDEVKLKAELAVDILDRNLYERANDCRWWALNPRISQALSQHPIDTRAITDTLNSIHALYTVYHDLYVFDANKRYVAFSRDEASEHIGHPVPETSGCDAVFALQHIQEYCVSPFQACALYDNQPTYIYNGAIRDPQQPNRITGGIGIVFNAAKEFQAILQDVLSGQETTGQALALFTDDTGKVIACSDGRYQTGQHFWPKINLTTLKQQGSLATLYRDQNQYYLLGAALSKGYRELKTEDGYDEPVIAWVLLPC